MVAVLPNHVCPVTNPFDRIALKKGGQVLGLTRVDARGQVWSAAAAAAQADAGSAARRPAIPSTTMQRIEPVHVAPDGVDLAEQTVLRRHEQNRISDRSRAAGLPSSGRRSAAAALTVMTGTTSANGDPEAEEELEQHRRTFEDQTMRCV